MEQAAGGCITVREEHLFWLEVLEDHAHFLRDYLSPVETRWWHEAERFIERFRAAIGQAAALPLYDEANSEKMTAFARSVYPLADAYCNLEGHMQHLRLWNLVNLNLTPSYFNGTINENREYLRQLSYLMKGIPAKPLTLTQLLDLWLEDQVGHAVLLQGLLDPVERTLGAEADKYATLFSSYMVKNRAMQGYLRFTPPGFPAEIQFATEVLGTTKAFYDFVQRVVLQYCQAQLLSKATLRFLEHHFPESCYFMRKLAAFIPGSPSFTDCPLTRRPLNHPSSG
ncbi:hypothetical protein PAECIP111893_03038 [Paenibacillus plantiphilus]|uniref:DUF2935 domain-containing protein n=1 Tax=Paenibacillus plantiphilus TaxID=2905650 RepID=A0ABM9CDF2_9BACL|nr:DUF2935 domain-containing protein [Paenibacillus plantiphilus]CAH1209504.1 hypothetical protein PAECIP111893_03038 [Paenibacillus plantiphilus]